MSAFSVSVSRNLRSPLTKIEGNTRRFEGVERGKDHEESIFRWRNQYDFCTRWYCKEERLFT